MRIQILSDLHLEFGPFEFREERADLIVLAGDIHVKSNGLKWISETIPATPVLYLAGNHEYYGSKLPRLMEKLKQEAEGTNIHVLENDVFEMGGFRFFGATLWTDLALHGDAKSGAAAAIEMNDYRRVRLSPTFRRLKPRDTKSVHHATVAAIRQFIAMGEPERSVIVTHHAPSEKSLPEQRRAESISCAYASHLDEMVEELRPLLWVHGHIHHTQDYWIGTTRVVANPRGYVDKPNPSFDPALVIDLEVERRRRAG